MRAWAVIEPLTAAGVGALPLPPLRVSPLHCFSSSSCARHHSFQKPTNIEIITTPAPLLDCSAAPGSASLIAPLADSRRCIFCSEHFSTNCGAFCIPVEQQLCQVYLVFDIVVCCCCPLFPSDPVFTGSANCFDCAQFQMAPHATRFDRCDQRRRRRHRRVSCMTAVRDERVRCECEDAERGRGACGAACGG